MKRVVAGVLLGGLATSPAWAGGGAAVSLSYGGAVVPKGDRFAPESMAVVRMSGFPRDAGVGMGMSARAHGGPDGVDVSFTPDLCIGELDRDFLVQVCGGMSVVSLSYRDETLRWGSLSPVVEPSFGFPLAKGNGGALFVSAPVGYDYRYGSQSGWYAGLTVGFGAFGD